MQGKGVIIMIVGILLVLVAITGAPGSMLGAFVTPGSVNMSG